MCLGAIKWVGIKEIFYAMDKDDIQTFEYGDNIFMDDSIVLIKNKIKNENLFEFTKNWYEKRDHIEN